MSPRQDRDWLDVVAAVLFIIVGIACVFGLYLVVVSK